ncbi:ECF RNA polymerase sigma factor SigW [compost metagenome]
MDDRELFMKYKEQVFRLCYYMMQNRSDAEDICQEVFVKAILSDRTQVREIKPWLLRIAANECNNVLKRRKNGWMKEMNAYLLSRPRLYNPVEEHLDQQEIRLQFKKLYIRLPDKIRIVLTLRYENELSVPEISGVIGIPEGTVKSRLNRGVQLLQEFALTQLKEMIGNESVL